MPRDLNKRWLTINNFSPEGNAWGGFSAGKSNGKGGDNDNCGGRVVVVAASWWTSWWWQLFVFLEMTPTKLEFEVEIYDQTPHTIHQPPTLRLSLSFFPSQSAKFFVSHIELYKFHCLWIRRRNLGYAKFCQMTQISGFFSQSKHAVKEID